jgi:hypothetical protein
MRACEACGKSLAGRTARARFCDSTCRMRAARDGPAVRELSAVDLARVEEMVALCRRELAERGCTDSALVESLVILTRQIHDPRTSSAGLVACVREARRLWPSGPVGPRPPDDLTVRRNRWRSVP